LPRHDTLFSLQSPRYGWPEDCYFKKGEKITPMTDIVELMIEGQICEMGKGSRKWLADRASSQKAFAIPAVYIE
jgi:hypothetical protein